MILRNFKIFATLPSHKDHNSDVAWRCTKVFCIVWPTWFTSSRKHANDQADMLLLYNLLMCKQEPCIIPLIMYPNEDKWKTQKGSFGLSWPNLHVAVVSHGNLWHPEGEDVIWWTLVFQLVANAVLFVCVNCFGVFHLWMTENDLRASNKKREEFSAVRSQKEVKKYQQVETLV